MPWARITARFPSDLSPVRWLVLFMLFVVEPCGAQPFLDVVNVSYLVSPDRLARVEANFNLPLELDSAGTLLVLSAGYEHWSMEAPADIDRIFDPSITVARETLNGFAVPVSFITQVVPDRWKLSITSITRYMILEETDRADWQLGGAFTFQRVKSASLTWKFGAYANADAFGLFALPLLGIDWRINAKSNLFGMLPGNFTYERKSTHWLRWGGYYRAITTSFGTRDGDFRRVDENTVGLFADLYFMKHMALRIETGHTALSQYQGGSLDPLYPPYGDGKYVDRGIGNGPYVRVLLAWRVRLDR
jgi:hypothetical protein